MKNKNIKKITICLVTANRPNTLKQALISIAKQSCQKYKLIVADDSKDNYSKKLVNKIVPKASYFHNQPPLGETINTNKVIQLAKTDYVCLFHDDDILAPDFLSFVYQAINKFQPDLIYTGRVMIDHSGKFISNQLNREFLNDQFLVMNSNDILNDLIIKKSNHYIARIMTPGLIFRKSLFNDCFGFFFYLIFKLEKS